jgi:hypothetical protein
MVHTTCMQMFGWTSPSEGKVPAIAGLIVLVRGVQSIPRTIAGQEHIDSIRVS